MNAWLDAASGLLERQWLLAVHTATVGLPYVVWWGLAGAAVLRIAGFRRGPAGRGGRGFPPGAWRWPVLGLLAFPAVNALNPYPLRIALPMPPVLLDGFGIGAVPLLGAAYLGGVLYFAGRLILNRKDGWLFAANCARPAPARAAMLAGRIARRLDVDQSVRLVCHRFPAPPLSMGGRRAAVIALPEDIAAGWPIDDLAPVIAHEMFHIKHGDHRRLARIDMLGVFLWWLPGWRRARRAALLEAEARCDRETVRDGCPPLLYANLLLKLAERAVAAKPCGGAVYFPAGGTMLEERITLIVTARGAEDGPDRRGACIADLWLPVLAAMACVRVELVPGYF